MENACQFICGSAAIIPFRYRWEFCSKKKTERRCTPAPAFAARPSTVASRNLVTEFIRCPNNHSAMFAFAIWSSFSPPEFPNVCSAASFCSYHASVLHNFSFLCLKCGNCLQDLQAQFRHRLSMRKWEKRTQTAEGYCFPAAVTRPVGS